MEEGIVKVPGSGPMRDQCLLCEYRISKFYAYIYFFFRLCLLFACMVLLIRLVGSPTSTRSEVGMGHIQ